MATPRRHRACNACRARKVRCSATGQHRCRECEHLNLRCEYTTPAPQWRRNRRGVVIQGHRPHAVQDHVAPLRPLQPLGQGHVPDGDEAASVTSSPHIHREGTFFALLPDYEASVFPFYPVITPAEAGDAIRSMQQDREAEAFVYALAAVTISLAHSLNTSETDEADVVLGWLSKSMAVLPGVLSIDHITIRRIIAVEFIHTSLAGLGRFEPAYHYLRQSVSMVEALKLGETSTMKQLSDPERARRQRLYYLIFIHERYFALFHHHPISMTTRDWLPDLDGTLPRQISLGFQQLILLFRHIDSLFLDAWLAISDDTRRVDPDWIQTKHRELEAEALDTDGLWPIQRADLIITKHWIRMLLWQIALSKCVLTSSSSEQAMSLLFPIGVSTQLRVLIGQVSRHEIEHHGSGIQQKLFELMEIMASVVLTISDADREKTRQRIDDFKFLFDFWRTLPRLNTTQLSILSEKDENIRKLAI